MGKRGPAPKPTAMRLLEGNPSKRKIRNTGEPMPPVPATVPNPPTRLLPDAKKEWRKLAPALIALGVLTEVDMTAFAELCQNYAYYLAVDKEITAQGTQTVYAMQKTPSGYIQQHPILSLRRQYYDQWRRGLQDFGLTPASRAHIVAGDLPQSTGDGEDARMLRLIRGDY